ncbi:MAG: alpha/beta hydrolase [Bacteroidota bacterium]
MKLSHSILSLLFITLLAAACEKEVILGSGETAGNKRYNNLIFANVDITSDVVYGRAMTQGGVDTELTLDIYEGQGDTESNRPVIIIAHGGGFTGGTKEEEAELAIYLARAGYLVASIKYRLLDQERNRSRIRKAVVDAALDMKAAVRFFRQDAATAGRYRIDSTKIFVGGYSAGAFAALHCGLVQASETNLLGGAEITGHIEAQGGWEGNSGNPGHSSSVTGVFSQSGAVISADLVSAGDPAVYSVHGTNDQVVPYVQGPADGNDVTVDGPSLYHPRLNQQNIPTLLRTIQDGNHDAFQKCSDCGPELRQFIFSRL